MILLAGRSSNNCASSLPEGWRAETSQRKAWYMLHCFTVCLSVHLSVLTVIRQKRLVVIIQQSEQIPVNTPLGQWKWIRCAISLIISAQMIFDSDYWCIDGSYSTSEWYLTQLTNTRSHHTIPTSSRTNYSHLGSIPSPPSLNRLTLSVPVTEDEPFGLKSHRLIIRNPCPSVKMLVTEAITHQFLRFESVESIWTCYCWAHPTCSCTDSHSHRKSNIHDTQSSPSLLIW